MRKAKKEEIDGLFNRKAFKLLHKKDMPIGSNVIGSRIVLAIKNVVSIDELCKIQLVAQGHADRENMLVSASVNIMQ